MTQPSDPGGVTDSQGFFQDLKNIKEDTVQLLRTYVQDFADKNPLLDNKEEYTDSEIRFALAKAFSDMNFIAPISIQVARPDMSVPFSFMMEFGAINLMEMSIFRKLRNDLQYTDSNVSVDTEKFQKYLSLVEFMKAPAVKKVQQYKTSLNYENIGAVLPSSHLFLGWLSAF